MLTNKTPWVVLLVLWMLGATYWHVCHIKQLCADVALPTTTGGTTTTRPPLTITDSDRFNLELPGNFSFAKSGFAANMDALGNGLDSLTAYLKANPTRMLTITGYYSPTETNASTFPNLGLARAEGIKQYLIQQGIRAASLTTKGEELPDLAFTANGDSLYGGLAFRFPEGAMAASEPEATSVAAETPAAETPVADTVAKAAPMKLDGNLSENDLAAKEKFTSVFKPIDLYFSLNQANYIQTADTKKFFAEATKYLNDNKGKKLLLTGHTDSKGDAGANMTLSRKRAADVKTKLVKLGVRGEQIEVRAKGETDPKADNGTLAGRKANRRVTVVVEQ